MNITRQFTHFTVLLSTLLLLVASGTRIANAQASDKEKELLAILLSDAAPAEKAITCKRLAIHGSAESVPELAKLLPNSQLSSWARIALESIPGAEADKALRDAAESLDGLLLVGTINSIGVRRDINAVGPLTARMKDADVEVAIAAAAALGKIGNDEATKSLRTALAISPNAKVRSAAAEGCVLCAERLWANGDADAAVEIYDQICKTELPKQRIIEATRGAILARKQDGMPILLGLFKSPDKQMFQLALQTAREFPGGEFDKALAAELDGAKPDRAALIIVAMADRTETVVLPAILKAATSGPKAVRLTAIKAIGGVGDASCVAALLTAAIDADADLALAAKTALAGLASDEVDAQIVAAFPTAKGKSYPLLIELVGQRRIEAAVPGLLKAVDNSDSGVRSAALTALGETVSLQRLPVLISQALTPKYPTDAAVAQKALKAASVRMPDREACAAELAKALTRAPAATKTSLLEIIGDVGGTTALRTLATAAKSKDPLLQDAGSRLLGKWNSVDAAPVLLDLAKTAPESKYQIRALRGYIGIVRKFAIPAPDRAAMCQAALDTASRTDEQKLVMDVLKLHPSAEGLAVSIKAMSIQAITPEATQASLAIAQKLGAKVDVNALAKAGFKQVKLEIVKAEYGAGAKQKDVTATIRKHAGNLPLITLPSTSYNTCFGGDPLPGSVKKLSIQYRINGKAATTTFPEDALIILTVPK